MCYTNELACLVFPKTAVSALCANRFSCSPTIALTLRVTLLAMCFLHAAHMWHTNSRESSTPILIIIDIKKLTHCFLK